MSRRVSSRLVLVAALTVAAVPLIALQTSCKKTQDTGVLDPIDLTLPDGGGLPFNAANLTSNDVLTDTLSVDGTRIQKFFARTPYARSCFLATYSSNGVRAADAIVRSARYYQINPIILLVRMQTESGLVSTDIYPFPTDRVEYAFHCGCSAPGVCDRALAGLDKQIDCLAAQYRTALDEISKQQKTSGGWATGTMRTTLDGVTLTPENDATAALYQVLPFVKVGEPGGNWVVWNVLREYSDALGYFGPGGP